MSDGPVSRFNGVEYSGSDERLLHAALLQRVGSGAFAARTGRRPGAAAPTASGLTITVPADAGVIYDSSLGGGPWLWALPSSKAVTLDERPGPGTSRIDVIVARIYDTEGQRELKIEAVKGEASGSPSKPDMPARSCEIATVTVPDSGAVSIVASTVRTVAAGGILPVATTAERDALPSSHTGLTVWNEQRGLQETFNGTSWVPGIGSRKTYSPSWSTAVGAQPSIGNGTLTGEYTEIGDLVTFTIRLRFGSTSNAGANAWNFTLPVAAADGRFSFRGTIHDTSADDLYGVVGVRTTGDGFVVRREGTAPLAGMGQSSPISWANGDTLEITGTYRRA